VGDWVTIAAHPNAENTVIIDGVLKRRTAFIRGRAGRRAREQVVAANLDIVFVVSGLDEDYNLRRIQRYLARIRAGGASPVVVLNKTDVVENSKERCLEVEAACSGVPVAAVSARLLNGLDPVRQYIRDGLTAAFVGSSGAGKSTLINALLGEERMATGDLREKDGRGCHTTTHRQLISFPSGGLLIDTPGMRELQLLDDEGLDSVFSDIDAVSKKCRFANCRHNNEPGCAVRTAIQAGELVNEQLDHYSKLEAEAELNTQRHATRVKRQNHRAVKKKLNPDADSPRRWKPDE
jgi:ribosome biogenesis GTPase